MTNEMALKWKTLGQLYAALQRASDAHRKEKSYASAQCVQDLQHQIKGLRGTFPKPRLVACAG